MWLFCEFWHASWHLGRTKTHEKSFRLSNALHLNETKRMEVKPRGSSIEHWTVSAYLYLVGTQHLPGIMSNRPCFRQQTHPLLQLLHMLYFQFTINDLISLGPRRNLYMSAACSKTGPEFMFYTHFVPDTAQNVIQVQPVLVPRWRYSEKALLL